MISLAGGHGRACGVCRVRGILGAFQVLQVTALAPAGPSGLALLPLHFEEELECVGDHGRRWGCDVGGRGLGR